MVVPILKLVGLSQGMLLWASVNMLSGWAVSRYVCVCVCRGVSRCVICVDSFVIAQHSFLTVLGNYFKRN